MHKNSIHALRNKVFLINKLTTGGFVLDRKEDKLLLRRQTTENCTFSADPDVFQSGYIQKHSMRNRLDALSIGLHMNPQC